MVKLSAGINIMVSRVHLSVRKSTHNASTQGTHFFTSKISHKSGCIFMIIDLLTADDTDYGNSINFH